MDWDEFSLILSRFAKVETVSASDILFGSGLDISSIAFTEFIMEIEDRFNMDVPVEDLDAGIKTAGQLFERLQVYTS